MKVSDAITHLEQLPCDDTIALAIWTIQDVHCMEQGLNIEEARKVLDYVQLLQCMTILLNNIFPVLIM